MKFSEPGLREIYAAKARIRRFVHHTPLVKLDSSGGILLKMEAWQITGSFKARGALNALWAATETSAGTAVVAASAGNHGLGVAHAAKICRRPAIVFVPENISSAKLAALQAYDAEVRIGGADYDAAEELGVQFAEQQHLPFVHAFADPLVIAGQGTIGLEIVEAFPQVEQIVVPVGGGGLISGLALAVKSFLPQVRIIGVQPEASPAMIAAVQAGRVVDTPIAATLADGLAGRFVHERTLALTRRYVDELVAVSEEGIGAAMRQLLRKNKIVAEGSAATGLAALIEQKVDAHPNTVIVLTGGNVASQVLQQLLDTEHKSSEI